jgi:hypothetical protein
MMTDPMLDLDARIPASPVLETRHLAGSKGVAWAEEVLREQEMPPDELRAVLTSADPELIKRHLDLHLERLDEWLLARKRSVEAVGRILAEHRDRQGAQRGSRSGRREDPL